MPRNMSFSLTTDQIYGEVKDVTRRLGWAALKPGELFWAVEKAMGLKPGQKIKRIKLCRCVSNRPERIDRMARYKRYGDVETIREGFAAMTGRQFVRMFCSHMKCKPNQIVNRIEFEYVK